MAGWLGAASGILGGISDRRAAEGSNRERTRSQRHALTELSPEAIAHLMRQFYLHFLTQMNPQMQSVMQGISNNLGRIGGTGMGVAQQLKAGVPGQFAQGALGQSFGAALPVAAQRAKVYTQDMPAYLPLGNWAGIASQGLQGFQGQYQGPRY